MWTGRGAHSGLYWPSRRSAVARSSLHIAANTGGSNISNDSASPIRIATVGSLASASNARTSRQNCAASTVASSLANRSGAIPAPRSTFADATPRSRMSKRHAWLTGYAGTATAITVAGRSAQLPALQLDDLDQVAAGV